MARDKFDNFTNCLRMSTGIGGHFYRLDIIELQLVIIGNFGHHGHLYDPNSPIRPWLRSFTNSLPVNRTKFLSSIATLKYLLNANGWSLEISLCTNDIFRIVPQIARALLRLSGRSGREQEIRRTNSRVLGSVLLHSRLILEMREPRRNLKRGGPALWHLSSPSEPLGSGLGSENSSMVGWRTFN